MVYPRKALAGWFLTAVFGGLLLMAAQGQAAALAIGAPVPAFSLAGADGKALASSTLAGKNVLVVIFSDERCTYGAAYHARLTQLHSEYAAKGVDFVLINPNTGGAAAKANYPFPALLDPSQATAKAFGATRTPEVFVFGKDGKLAYRGQIDDNTEEKMVKRADLKLALDALLGGAKAVEKPVTSAFGCSIK